MPRTAKVYIALILVSGAALLLVAAGSWSPASLWQYLALLCFTAAASTLKIRIPGVESTVSPNFLFLLLAMLSCSFSEVIAITLTAALVQSIWGAKRLRLIQVAFSAAALVLSAAAAYECAHRLLGVDALHSPVAFVILAGSLYLSLDTALVSAVIGLAEGRPPVQVARACCECVFPYFISGIALAGLISSTFPRATVWNGAIALFPIVVLGYLYLQNRTRSAAPARIQPASKEEEELVESAL
jgi:hypothetical protein